MWLGAEVWLDKSFVTLLKTGWFSKEGFRVLRWSDGDRARLMRPCSLALRKYAKGMGAVDRVNKEVAFARMALGRCRLRFQRQMFFATTFPIVGLVNVRIAFCWLWPEIDALRASAGTFGFNRRFQLRLGENVIRCGIDWCKARPEETFTSRWKESYEGEEKDGPHFMPERIKKVGPGTPSARAPKRCSVEHEYVSTSKVWIPIAYDETGKKAVDWLGARSCKNCQGWAKQEGSMAAVDEGKQVRRTTPEGNRVPNTRWACAQCKVNLCSQECFDAWDHVRCRFRKRSEVVHGGPSCGECDE